MRAALALVFCLPLVLTGCSFGPTAEPSADAGLAVQGAVRGGQQPITGARVYLLAANITGNAGPGIAASSTNKSLSLLSGTGNSDSIGSYVLSDSSGKFSISGDYSCTPNTQVYLYALGGNPGLGTGVNAVSGLMTALGSCPSTGNFQTATPYIVINEVSTIAAAYAFSGYATDATHVSSSGSALATIGIQNAFANAANLASLSTGNALTTTPNGNGTVPQYTINTLADIIASCVNSNGAITGPTNPTACYTLFTNATSNGTSSGTQPLETATAAINIAHNPSSNIDALSSLITPQAAFGPTVPVEANDFTIGIEFSGGGLNDPYSIAIDGYGNPWVINNGNSSVTQLAASGTPISPSGGYTGGGLNGLFGGIAIDSAGNAWIPNYYGGTVTEFYNCGYFDGVTNCGKILSGTLGYAVTGLHHPYGVAIDGSDNIWVTSFTTPYNVVKFSFPGGTLSSAAYSGGGLAVPYSIAIDGTGNAWIINKNNNSVTEFSNTGTANINAPFTGGGLDTPYSIAMDGSGNAWIANYAGNNVYGNSVSEFSNTGAVVGGANGYIGAGLNLPDSIAMDGSGNAWLANSLGNSVSEFSNSGTPITGANGYIGGNINSPNAVAVDGSGNVWVANLYDSTMTELIGAATPVVTPLAVGVKNKAVASRP
jgi:hypothetical protein